MFLSGSRRAFPTSSQHCGVVIKDTSTNFKAGIDQVTANSVKTKLSTMKFKGEKVPTETLRMNSDGHRWVVDETGRAIGASEAKKKEFDYRIALLCHHYDVRMNASMETPQSLSSINTTNFNKQRKKVRTSYKSVHLPYWQVDYTEVTEQDYNSSGVVTNTVELIELELELTSTARRDWMSSTEKESMEITRRIAQQLMHLIDSLLPHESNATLSPPLIKAEGRYNEQLLESLRIIRPEDTRKYDFLGAMAVNTTRQNLALVLARPYYITEKSDGERYLLHTIKDGTQTNAVLCSRSKDVYSLEGGQFIGLGLGEGAILDGELVFNLTQQKYVFLVFDVLAFNKQSYVTQKFEDRMNVLNSFVMPQFVDRTKVITLPMVPLVAKTFVPKSQIRTLLGNIKTSHNDEYIYQAASVTVNGNTNTFQHHHKTDGIIFQPNTPYTFSKDFSLLKWKWADLRSIDVQIVYNSSDLIARDIPKVALVCDGPDGMQINCSLRGQENIALGKFDTYRLLADAEQHKLKSGARTPIIAEVGYDVVVGLWTYMKLRRDKVKPNYIDTVMGVLMEHAESISVEELEYTIVCSELGRPLDYQDRLKEMKKQLMKWFHESIEKKPSGNR